MNFTQDESALYTLFIGPFQAVYPLWPIDLVGLPRKPVDGKLIRFRISRAASETTSIGGSSHRNYGSVMIQIIRPQGSGPGGITSVSDFIAPLYRNVRVGGLKCREPSLRGPFEDGALMHGTLDVPYYSHYST